MTWKKDGKEEKKVADDPKEKLKNMKVKCRICDGEHFTARCPFKDTMAPIGEDGAAGAGAPAADGEEDGPPKEGGLGTGGGGYVPPHLRKGGAAGAGERMGGKYERDDLATLRVTNVSSGWGNSLLFWGGSTLTGNLFVCRFLNSRKRMICGRYSNALAESRASSLLRIGIRIEQKGSPSSVSRSGPMLQRHVRKSTAVSAILISRIPQTTKPFKAY